MGAKTGGGSMEGQRPGEAAQPGADSGTGGPRDHSTSREIPGALAWGLISKVLVSILALASNVLIVRGLGEASYGIYSIFLNIARFLSLVIGLGLAQSILQFLPEMRVKENARGGRQLLHRAVFLQLATWVVVLGAVYLLRGWISGLYRTDLREILLLGSAFLIFEVFWIAITHVYMAVRRMRPLTMASVAQKAALIGFLLLLLPIGISIQGVLCAVAGSFLVGIVVLGPGLSRTLPWVRGQKGSGLPTARLMKYALPFALGAVINQVLWRSSEALIIAYYWEPKVVGYFNAAYNLPQMVLEFIPIAVWPVVLASLSEVHARRSENLLRGIGIYFRLISVFVIPPAITGFVFGRQAYLLLYSEKMAPGAPICQLFFLVFLLSLLIIPLRTALYVKERALLNMMIAGVGAVVNVALDFVFIPRYGIWGAVPPVAIALVVSGILQYLASKRVMPGIGIPWGHLGRVLLGSAVVLPLWFVRDHLTGPLALVAALVLGTLVQYLLLRALRVFGPEEREIFLRSNLPMKRLIADLLAPQR